MASIQLQGITKAWGDAQAVKGIDFEVKSGDFTVLLGPSGCGKSTTLRLIAGLDTPTTGSIHIGDRDVTYLSPADRKIAMVFQSYALFPHLSVRENILFGVKVRKEPKQHFESRLKHVADILSLSHLLDRRPSQLSGGQQQRVALGRAIIADAPVCLMDEPLSNLDAQLRQEMRREIRALQQQLKMTMVYVTHDQTEAMSMADQVILLKDGRIEQNAPPATLYAQPASIFAARFIGTPPMNIVPLTRQDNTAFIQGSPDSVIQNVPDEADIALGVRPEHIILADQGYAGTIVNIEYFGADTILGVSIGDQIMLAKVPGQHTLKINETVHLQWLPEHQYFFSRTTGLRVHSIVSQSTSNQFVQLGTHHA